MNHLKEAGLRIWPVEDPNQPIPDLCEEPITDIRGKYYRGKGWMVNIPAEYFWFIEYHLALNLEFDISLLGDRDYNESLDGPVAENNPRTYIVYLKNQTGNELIATERFAIDPNKTLLNEPAKFVVVENGKLKYLTDTAKGKKIIGKMRDEKTGIIDLERLVPLNKDKPEELSRLLAKHYLGAYLDQLPGIKLPGTTNIPERLYDINWVPNSRVIPEEYSDIFGKGLDVDEDAFFNVVGLNPRTNRLEIDTIAIMSFSSREFIRNSQNFLEEAVNLVDNFNYYEVINDPSTTNQGKIINKLARAIITYGLHDSHPQRKAS